MLSSDLLIILVIVNSALIAGILTLILQKNKKSEPISEKKNDQSDEKHRLKIKAKLLNQEQRSKLQHQSITIPLKIQAIERFTLLLERTKPESLILRNSEKANTVRGVANLILSEIRQEYEHNSSQQIYISEATWQLIRLARQQTITLIQEASNGLDPQGAAIELSISVLDLLSGFEQEIAHDQAISLLRKEMQEYL